MAVRRAVAMGMLAAGILAGCVLPPPYPGDSMGAMEDAALPPVEYVVGGAPVYYAVEPGVAYYPIFLDTPGSCHCVVPMRYAGGVWFGLGGVILHRGYLPLRHPAPHQREIWLRSGGVWQGHAPLHGSFGYQGSRPYSVPPPGSLHGDRYAPPRGQPYPYRRHEGSSPGYEYPPRGAYPGPRQNPPAGYGPPPQPAPASPGGATRAFRTPGHASTTGHAAGAACSGSAPVASRSTGTSPANARPRRNGPPGLRSGRAFGRALPVTPESEPGWLETGLHRRFSPPTRAVRGTAAARADDRDVGSVRRGRWASTDIRGATQRSEHRVGRPGGKASGGGPSHLQRFSCRAAGTRALPLQSPFFCSRPLPCPAPTLPASASTTPARTT